MENVERKGDEHDINVLGEVIGDLKALVASAGWRYYIKVIEEQMQARYNEFFTRSLDSMDQTLGQEYSKGEAAGLKIATLLPDQLIDDFSSRLEEWKSKLNQGDEE